MGGDEPADKEALQDPDVMKFGVDLVRLLRWNFGDYFTVCVGGYPGGHPSGLSYEDDLVNQKQEKLFQFI